MAFYGGLLVVAWHLWHERLVRPVAVGLVCVTIAFIVDQSYFYPPNVMNVYLVAVLASKLKVNGSDAVLAAVETGYHADRAMPRKQVSTGTRQGQGLLMPVLLVSLRPLAVLIRRSRRRKYQRSFSARAQQNGSSRSNPSRLQCSGT